MTTIDDVDDRRAIRAPGFRLAFLWTGDRWSHALDLDLGLGAGADLRRIVASIEGQADPGRIVSPALQQLQFQRPEGRPETAQALLVGQSGAHHFSAVFSVSDSPAEVLLTVEIADRCRIGVDALASTYAVDLPASDLADADDSAVSWNLPCRPGALLTFMSEPPARAGLREAGRRGCQVQASARIVAGIPTHRWGYSWRLRRRS